jgi:hypothetical protein
MNCPATASPGGTAGAVLSCDLWADHKPPIHWDKTVGVHWFRMEDIGGAMVYDPAPTLDL